jgi:hypothetical protein
VTFLKSSEHSEKQPKYFPYLLRLWQGGSEAQWHIYLQDVDTGVQRQFLSLESFTAYLQAQIEPEQDD